MSHTTVEIQGKKFTQVSSSRYRQINWNQRTLPPCQISEVSPSFGPCPKGGEFDTPLLMGPWADMCPDHVETFQKKNSATGFHRMVQERTPDGD